MDDQAQYEAELVDIRAMFEHPGWRALVRQTQDRLDKFRAGFPFSVKTLEQLYFTHGVVASLTELVNMEDSLNYISPDPVEEE